MSLWFWIHRRRTCPHPAPWTHIATETGGREVYRCRKCGARIEVT